MHFFVDCKIGKLQSAYILQYINCKLKYFVINYITITSLYLIVVFNNNIFLLKKLLLQEIEQFKSISY